MRIAGAGDFFIWPDRIICHNTEAHSYGLVEICLLGMAFSLWLEMRGVKALHTSAVVRAGRVVAFIGGNGNGKSSLVGAMMEAGCPLITDDLLPVRASCGSFVAYPSYPQVRLWPEEAQFFLGHYAGLQKVHPEHEKRKVHVGIHSEFGSFSDEPAPVGCIYRPVRYNGRETPSGIRIEPVTPVSAVIELLAHSFAAELMEAAGLQAERMRFFARMARAIPMRRIIYPTGLKYLRAVRDVVLDDLTSVIY